MSFGPDKLLDNAKALIDSVLKAKPAAAKGKYVKSIALSSTMGPGVRVDLASVEAHGVGGRNHESRPRSRQLIDDLHQEFGQSPHAILVDFRGLSVPAVTEFRRKVRQAGSRYRVVKNTLALRAVKDTPLESAGRRSSTTRRASPTPGSDPVALAKILIDFAKDHPAAGGEGRARLGHARCSTRRG